MCLHTEQLKPLTAEKDITCYKVVYAANTDGVFRSEFREFKYSLGVKYVEEKFDKAVQSCTVRKGFHSYRTLDVARHCALPQCVLLRCLIPKGSMYYESRAGDQYCSDALISVAWKPLWGGKWSTEP